MDPSHRIEEVKKKSEERADNLLEAISRKIEETLREMREQGKENEGGIEDEFHGGHDFRKDRKEEEDE